MSEREILERLDELARRVADVAARLASVESVLSREAMLRERLEHEEEARRRLGDQTQWLVETLGNAKNQIRWLERKLEKRDGMSGSSDDPAKG